MVFVVFGKRDKRPVTISQTGGPSTARVTAGGHAAGFALTHDHACWCEANQIDPVGDLNGDGRADFAVSWTNPFAAHGDRTDVVYGRRSTRPVKLPGRAGLTVTGTGSVTPFVGLGDLTGDRRDDLLVGGDRHNGLWLVRGRRAHGRVAFPQMRAVGPNEFTLAQPIGDVDGDGHLDLLVAAGIDNVHFSVVYGADPFAPVDVTVPGTAAVRLPPPPA
jgi:FG-GAP-like repeat